MDSLSQPPLYSPSLSDNDDDCDDGEDDDDDDDGSEDAAADHCSTREPLQYWAAASCHRHGQ